MEYDFTELENKNILLRKVNINDVNDIFYNLTSSEEVTRYLPWSKHKDKKETLELVKKWEMQYKEGMNYRWIIIEKKSDKAVGLIYTTDLDLENRIANIKFIFANNLLNEDIIIQSLEMVMDHLFTKESFLIIKSTHSINNKGFDEIMGKVNMTFEGVEKDIYINKSNKTFDIIRYSINKKQWLSRNCIKYR